MKKNYIAPQVEDVVLEATMAGPTFLGVASNSAGVATVNNGEGA